MSMVIESIIELVGELWVWAMAVAISVTLSESLHVKSLYKYMILLAAY